MSLPTDRPFSNNPNSMRITDDKHSAKSNSALDMARQALYRFAAISFSDPQVEVWDLFQELAADPLVHDAAKLLRQEPRAAAVALGRGELPLGKLRPEMVLQRLPSSLRELNLEYEQTFGLLVSSAVRRTKPSTSVPNSRSSDRMRSPM